MSEKSPGKTRITMNLHEQDEHFEQILQAAIVANWADLMRGRSGLVHLEYGFGTCAKLDYLQVWSSIRRGYWLLACTYWMSASPSHGTGVHFDNGYETGGLARILEFVMENQNLFGLPQKSRPKRPAPNRNAYGERDQSGSRLDKRRSRSREVVSRAKGENGRLKGQTNYRLPARISSQKAPE